MKFTTIIATVVSMAAFAIAAPVANEGCRRSSEPRHVRQGHYRWC
ncbi:hypothetical protein AA0119_g5074 [Alternaria tenuissima]|uniref:Uncharacterized protein n=2 Tax=Alternaria alternata complex TaxID=187734 RepID=A0A4Q4NT58_ALTAL|nr:hypothetical protein AA0115_g1789 [Alternaria tenuissima]RYN83310.1 hypothetical protein AA0117_g1417 [Alternaria alternata]RYO02960.1 hypothetical protein AA0119_g5074 [Alternaria tenuissima]RYO25248.1 hypothetical protein AA0121_g1425 [Alternaria tenuissima]